MPRSVSSIAAKTLRVTSVGILFVLVVLSAFSLLTILSRATFGVSLRLAIAGVGVSTIFAATVLLAIWVGSHSRERW
jgi:hypothetical protein